MLIKRRSATGRWWQVLIQNVLVQGLRCHLTRWSEGVWIPSRRVWIGNECKHLLWQSSFLGNGKEDYGSCLFCKCPKTLDTPFSFSIYFVSFSVKKWCFLVVGVIFEIICQCISCSFDVTEGTGAFCCEVEKHTIICNLWLLLQE